MVGDCYRNIGHEYYDDNVRNIVKVTEKQYQIAWWFEKQRYTDEYSFFDKDFIEKLFKEKVKCPE